MTTLNFPGFPPIEGSGPEVQAFEVHDEHPRPGLTLRVVTRDGATTRILYDGGWKAGEYKTKRGAERAVERRHAERVAEGRTRRVEDLRDGDFFSLDNGRTWHTCAVVLFGSVAVYTGARRDDDAPTVRVDADRDQLCTVRI